VLTKQLPLSTFKIIGPITSLQLQDERVQTAMGYIADVSCEHRIYESTTNHWIQHPRICINFNAANQCDAIAQGAKNRWKPIASTRSYLNIFYQIKVTGSKIFNAIMRGNICIAIIA
jgi:hypothetical protein